MSSVDLHTHSGFQRMLPESFAVVCAPSSKPQYVYRAICALIQLIRSRTLLSGHRFGIFRLTNPVGLQAIQDCTAKEAFHPHPDVPIYTVSRLPPYDPLRVLIDRPLGLRRQSCTNEGSAA